MLETPHAVIGAAIATKVVNPVLAIPLSFISHFALDKVPHWNPHLNTEKNTCGHVTTRSRNIVIGDVVLSLALGSYIAFRALPDYGLALTILFSCFAAVLPDLMEGPYFFLNQKSQFITKWIKFQKILAKRHQCDSRFTDSSGDNYCSIDLDYEVNIDINIINLENRDNNG